jgi:hypothetical protein
VRNSTLPDNAGPYNTVPAASPSDETTDFGSIPVGAFANRKLTGLPDAAPIKPAE